MHRLFALVEVLDNRSKVIQVLTNHSKLLYGELFPVVVVVKVVRLDLLELLFLIRLLHVDCIVVETSDVFGCVYDLAGLQIVNGLVLALSRISPFLHLKHSSPFEPFVVKVYSLRAESVIFICCLKVFILVPESTGTGLFNSLIFLF